VADLPNVLFILTSGLRASSLPMYGERQIETPGLDRLAEDGVAFTHALATCPASAPVRSMILTGRHPQTTGHLINFVRARHDEMGFGDVLWRAGYRTGWVGLWHLHTGAFPCLEGPDYVPEGRDRMGFEHWRGYNFHTRYFGGWVNVEDWRNEAWEGYETQGLLGHAMAFMDAPDDRPFCLFVCPHQPHPATQGAFAPEACYARLPERVRPPAGVPDDAAADPIREAYRHYLAMILALDDMVAGLLDYLDRTDRLGRTLLVLASDRGVQMGAHGAGPWDAGLPYEESLRVPLVVRWSGVMDGGGRRGPLVAPVDLFPSLCGLLGLRAPRTIEGFNLADAWRGAPGAFEQEALLTMNFSADPAYLVDGGEWRGARTKQHSFVQWRSGRTELYDLAKDPRQQRNLSDDPALADVRGRLERRMASSMGRLGDEFGPARSYQTWFDPQRRVIRNTRGAIGDPEAHPDWTQFA
jgi:arylsulfatase A-like enzyme